jgi:hypothetical protein
MGKNQDPGSGINIPDPQHCFLPDPDPEGPKTNKFVFTASKRYIST